MTTTTTISRTRAGLASRGPLERYTLRMPTWAKVLLIVLVAGILCTGVAVFLGIRWARRGIRQIRQDGPRLVAEAQDFGRGKDGEACVAESLSRLGRCDGFICEAKTKLFLANCLSTATIPSEFCKDVPRHGEILKTATWAQTECSRRGFSDVQRCTRVIIAIQEHCAR
jgi:hypothetical protein